MTEFTSSSSSSTAVSLTEAKVQGSLIGHQGRCFDLRFHPHDHNLLISASEDGVVKLWDVQKRTCKQTMVHNKAAEVLRAGFVGNVVSSAGSDGQVHLWSYLDQQSDDTDKQSIEKGQKIATLQHRNENSQVYVCEAQGVEEQHSPSAMLSGTTPSLLLTAADSDIYLWDIEHTTQPRSLWNYTTEAEDESQVFGGVHRNPEKEVYVFDAKWCPTNPHEAAVALSDSTIRLLDIRQSQSSVLSLSLTMEELEQAGVKLGHATSVNWNHSGNLCSVGFGSGIIALIDIRMGECLSISRLHTGPCYGATFLPNQDNIGLSWSADSTMRIWKYISEQAASDIQDDIITTYHSFMNDFSILSCAVHPSTGLIVVGGGSKSSSGGHTKPKVSFLGTPIYLVNPTTSN